MAQSSNGVLTALLAFAGGFVAGILLAPDSGSGTRGRIASTAKDRLAHLDDQLDGLTGQLDALQNQIQKASQTIAERVKTVAIGEEGDWEVADDDVNRDLRRMPRK